MSPTVTVRDGAQVASQSYVVAAPPPPPPSITAFKDFAAKSGLAGLLLPAAGFSGATTFQMQAKTSTKGPSVPTAAGKTNGLYLVSTQPGLTGKTYEQFTVQATDQGHLYGGLLIDHQTSAIIRGVKVIGIPGGGHTPPPETFDINEWDGLNNTYYDCEVDGAGASAAGWGANTAKGIKLYRVNVHDCPFSTPTFWQSTSCYTEDLLCVNNLQGINAERCDDIHHVRPVVDLRKAAAKAPMHFTIQNDQINSKSIVIEDPVCRGGMAGDGVTTVMISAGYSQSGSTQKQTIDGVTLKFGGVAATWLKASQANFAKAAAAPTKYGVWFS